MLHRHVNGMEYVENNIAVLVTVYGTVRLLVPGHFYFYVVSDFLLRENDISVLLL